MAFLSGREAFLKILQAEGVKYIFGNPGSTELPIMDALAGQKDIRYILALHEGVAISMADGYAVASGNLAVVNVHVSPGLGNSMGMLYNASKSGAPIIVTAGQHDQSFLLSEPILWSNLPEVARPYVKWAYEVRRLEDLPRALHRAAKVATAPPSGPVFLSLPVDVLKEEKEIELGGPTRIEQSFRPSRKSLEAAAELLLQAKNPVIIAGDMVARGQAHQELAQVAEIIGAPVYQNPASGTCNFPFNHPLSLGPLPRVQKVVREALNDKDVLFAVGGELVTMSLPSEIEPLPPGIKIIHLHQDPWEIGKNYPTQVAMMGEARETLLELAKILEAKITPEQRNEAYHRREVIRQSKEKIFNTLKEKIKKEKESQSISGSVLMDAICEVLPAEAVIVDETISSGRVLRNLWLGSDPQCYFGLRGGGIGWGLPASLGIKLALPDRPVVALVGDGSAMYSYQGLWTAAHYGLKVIFIICNNASYRILKERTYALRGFSAQTNLYVGMDLKDPEIDFPGLAKALGVKGERAEEIKEVQGLLKKALAGNQPYLIDVPLDPSFL
ncbi:MAG: thiamine pyrophosphate-binding protein [Thermodesulfobacteriota bacterium]